MQIIRNIGFGLATLLAAAPLCAETNLVVEVTGGQIRGTLDPSANAAVFKGIPFARPPVGDLRWREPQPVKPWKGVRDATTFGASCVQNPAGMATFLGPLARLYGAEYQARKLTISEDCLYLNVWTPEWPATEPVAVMVWIHGGSNVMGSGTEPSYDGAALARKGVVVVTINYRLGVFGFFAHPALTRESPHQASGNYGLLDQIAALEWVHRNIAAFGGDPGRVTVFGQSAGALNAGLLLCSPLAKDLVHRMILESGPALGLVHHPATLERGERLGESAGRSLGDAGDMKKLRAAAPEAVIKAHAEALARGGDPGYILDGWCLRTPLGDLFARGEQLHVELIIGNNGREMSAFRAAAASRGERKAPANGDSLKNTVRIFYGGATTLVAGMFLIDNAVGRTKAADSWLNDIVAACPGMAMASLQAEAGRRAYVYQFLRSVPGRGEDVLGAFHGLEVPYVFGAFRQSDWSWLPFAPVDFALGAAIQRYWTNFAKTGNPNAPDLPGWPGFDAKTQGVMVFGKEGIASARTRAKPAFCDVEPRVLSERLLDPASNPVRNSTTTK